MPLFSRNALLLVISVFSAGLVVSPRGNEVGLAEASTFYGLCTPSAWQECYVAVSMGEACATECEGNTKYFCSGIDIRCDYFASGPEGYEAYECGSCVKTCPGTYVMLCTPGSNCKEGCVPDNCTNLYVYSHTNSTEADCP